MPIDLSLYAEQLRLLQEDSNTRIVGSIGRMVSSLLAVGMPYAEFDDRIAAGLHTTRISDIDVVGARQDALVAARNVGEAVVDNRAFGDSDVAVECRDGLWVLKSSDVEFEEELHPGVMNAIAAEVEGIEIVTVPLQTHLALHTLRPRNATKDNLTEKTLRYLLHSDKLDSGGLGRIDERSFLPFMRLSLRLRQRNESSTDRHSYDDERHSE